MCPNIINSIKIFPQKQILNEYKIGKMENDTGTKNH